MEERRTGLGAVAAGLIGGVIALVGAGALQYAGLIGAPGGTAASGVNDRIAAVSAAWAALDSGAEEPSPNG